MAAAVIDDLDLSKEMNMCAISCFMFFFYFYSAFSFAQSKKKITTTVIQRCK